MESAEATFDFARTARMKFETGDYKVRTEIIRKLGLNLKLLDKKIWIKEDYPWLFIKKAKQELEVLQTQGLEPEKCIEEYEKTGVSNPVISTLQGYQDSNLDERFWRPPYYHCMIALIDVYLVYGIYYFNK